MIHWTQLVNGLVMAIVIYFAARIALNIQNIVTRMIKTKRRRKLVEQNHCKKPHEYIKLYLPQLNKEGNICKNCGYCSDLDDYFNVAHIHAYLMQREAQKKYEDWKEEQLEEISMELEMGFDKTEKLANRILGFRRDYQIHFMEEQMKKGDNER